VISTCSGTAALHAAYFALDLAPGDEVLAPAYTHLGTVLPMLHARLAPVLCDVEPDTGNLDLRDAASRITARTRAIVVTHQYGQAPHPWPGRARAQRQRPGPASRWRP
jgi:dTDP-4-amino-4,6-dideoxygalactose transaminase